MTAANSELVLQFLPAVNEALADGRLAGHPALVRLTGATDHAVRKTPQHQPAGWSPGLTPQIGAAGWAIALLLSIEVGRGVVTVRGTQMRGGRR